jgi:hypothetical protein
MDGHGLIVHASTMTPSSLQFPTFGQGTKSKPSDVAALSKPQHRDWTFAGN